MASRNGQVFLAWRDLFVRLAPAGATQREQLPGPVRSLAAAAPFTRVRVAAALQEGGMLFWEDGESRPFADGMAEPAVGFTRGGALVAVATGLGRAYRTEGKTLKLHSSFASFSPEGPPVAVTPTDQLNQFAVFTADGQVRVYQLAT
jgi:hypothetical protein